MIYLDNAATSFPKPPGFAEHAAAVLAQPWGNPFRGSHRASQDSQALVERVRDQVARLINAPSPEHIVIGASTTQMLNQALAGIAGRFGVERAITSPLEHNSVLRPLLALARGNGVALDIAEADARGDIDLRAALERAAALSPQAPLLALAHAVNTTGQRRDLARVARLAREYGAFSVIDAAQTAGSVPLDVQATPVDALAFGAHKGLLGPTGLGFLYLGPRLIDARLAPLFVGGGGDATQPGMPDTGPQRFEAGTPNLHALALLEHSLGWLQAHAHSPVDTLCQRLRNDLSALPGVTVYGDEADCRGSGIVLFNVGALPAHTVAQVLDADYGIAVRAGLHCAPLAHRHLGSQASHQGAVRASFGKFSTEGDRAALARAIADIAAHAAATTTTLEVL